MENNIKQLVQDVLRKGYLMSLATVDEGGLWVADVIYIHDNVFAIYWMSDPDARHSEAIVKKNQVAATITASGKGEHNLGIQFIGVASKIEGARPDLAVMHFEKRNKPAPKETDDVLGGDSWYMLKPSMIELISEGEFGFEKKKITF